MQKVLHRFNSRSAIAILAEKLASDYNLINLGGWGEDSDPHRTGVAAVRDGNALLLWTHFYVTARGQFPVRFDYPTTSLADYQTNDREYHGHCYAALCCSGLGLRSATRRNSSGHYRTEKNASQRQCC
jgi:hypothetical protein